jgi:hypothetical protein
MTRFWVSWWTGNYADEGCTEPPFHFWVTGYRDRKALEKIDAMPGLVGPLREAASAESYVDRDGEDEDMRDEVSACALVQYDDPSAVFTDIAKHFPDREFRFCEPRKDGWTPSDRFPKHQGEARAHDAPEAMQS